MHVGLNKINRANSLFSGAVSYPGAPLLELPTPAIPDIQIVEQPQPAAKQPEKAVSLSGIVLGRLMSLKPESPELKGKLSDLISSAAELLAECDAIEQECHEERLTKLQRQHEHVRSEGRKKLKEITALEKRFGEANQFWNQAREGKGQHEADLRARMEEQSALGQWATDDEIAAANAAVEKAKRAYTSAAEREAMAMREYSAADSALASAQATLAELAKDEAAVSAELDGVPHYDARLGLEVR